MISIDYCSTSTDILSVSHVCRQLNSMEQRLSADITAILRVLQQRNGGLPQSLNIPHVAIDIRDVNT